MGWMVTDEGMWFTEESGKTWKKLSEQIKPDKNIGAGDYRRTALLRVCFLDEKHGFGVGAAENHPRDQRRRAHLEAGPWRRKPAGNPAYTAYTHIIFAGTKHGLIFGGSASAAQRRRIRALPSWMDPERASKRKQLPTLTLLLKTDDRGATWESSTVPLFGLCEHVRFMGTEGLIVIGFNRLASSGLRRFSLDARSGKDTNRVFRDKTPRVIDCALFVRAEHVYLAGVEPHGKLNTAALPGK